MKLLKKKEKKYDTDLPTACRFCERASLLEDGETVLCSKNGIMPAEYACKKYSYDPLKRVPRRLPALPTLSDEDFLL